MRENEGTRESPRSSAGCRATLKGALLGVLACLIAVIGSAQLNAGQERYDYDALGRLIRVIDEQGRVTEYLYDAAGNILQVITGGTAQAPAITAISPTSIRRGETAQVTITGSGFTGAEVSASDPGLDISGVQTAATQISFSLAATLTATLGLQQIAIRSAAGTASASITVNQVLPKLGMSPQPVAVPPDNVARNVFVTLSSADTIDYVIALASVNPAVATVSPASVTIPAGQTQILVSVTGKSTGNTTINLSAAGLASVSVPVFVSAEFLGYRTNLALPLGVVVQSPTTVTSTVRGPFASKLVGVAKGAYISGVAPKAVGCEHYSRRRAHADHLGRNQRRARRPLGHGSCHGRSLERSGSGHRRLDRYRYIKGDDNDHDKESRAHRRAAAVPPGKSRCRSASDHAPAA